MATAKSSKKAAAEGLLTDAAPVPGLSGANVPGQGDGTFGDKVRALRKGRGLSLKDVAQLSELSVALISQVERGINAPSMRSLRQLAKALGVGVETLFTEVSEAGDASSGVVVRHGHRRVLNLGHTGTFMELLTPTGFEGLQTFHSYISPGAGSGPEYDSHVGTESGVVLSGRFDLWLDGVKHSLGPGDSFSFQSTVPHRYGNPGKTMTQVIWAITPPIY
jgi:quercetin dioxygenase-like cupin family protein